MSKKRKNLPVGISYGFYYNPCDRELKDPKKRRYCYVAYTGKGKTSQSKRFFVDQWGNDGALEMAIAWRTERVPLNKRQGDITKLRQKLVQLKADTLKAAS